MNLDSLPLSNLGKVLSLLIISFVVTDGKSIVSSKSSNRRASKRELDTKHANTQNKIVLLHNFYRSKVEPPASDMLQMKWLEEAQDEAQEWAEKCKYLKHNKGVKRRVENFGSCGQNIFVSNTQKDWMHVIKSWYLEHRNFTYGSDKNKLEQVGHYTQMVWYNSHRLGCGFHHCGKDKVKTPFYNYVCNYCPIGNDPKRLSKPYTTGKPCDKCPKYCKYKKLCKNSCPFTDFFVNCAEINVTWHSWLCDDDQLEKFSGCKATCRCPNAIL
ncbi:cysteine-rich secretory protein 2-like [Uloborus diversus]|uniref:cysteine-rich secretory protein 2-like n=1 Tax=Uloborus diversus TaxID=327109 RepID=UPI00240A12CB|nr:cysteine-rich secretory protein 2-like [Uloborus diversus]